MTMLETDRRTLLDVARVSIHRGFVDRRPLGVHPADFADALRAERAAFVTLRIEGKLRGCIGSLEATRTLVEDVAINAFNAAFHDPRFEPLSRPEFDRVTVSLSILQPPEPMTVADEADLLTQLRPGVDGLTLHTDGRRATFLPAVWQTLPEPRAFLTQLKAKAGLGPEDWPADLRVERYRAEHIG